MTSGFPAVWGAGFWGNNVWEDVGPAPPPDTGGDFQDSGATHSIEFALTLRCEQEIVWSRPPAAIFPLRNYRAVMDDYRVLGGIPVTPPTLDAAVPVLVGVDPKGVAIPTTKRSDPADIDTLATLRWCSPGSFVNDDNPVVQQWWDTTGRVAWSSYDNWQPLLDPDYSYQIPRPNNAEVVLRSVMIFDPSLGSCMSTSLSIDPINTVSDVEFFLVLWTHPLQSGQQFSTLLDNGQDVQGFHDLPYTPGDSMTGYRQALQRYPDKLVRWQDTVGTPLYWAQASSGRPVLYRVRFGRHPLLEVRGPTNSHMSISTPTLKQPSVSLCADYVLGRLFNRLDPVSNGGMHLFEINYYDHELSTQDADTVFQALNSCYAIGA